MVTPVTNIGMSDIQTEFGGAPETSLTEYYRTAGYVPEGQEKSAHHVGRIPLAPQFIDGGDGPGSFTGFSEISIGMFRGLSKKFKHAFNITADRFTTFNLSNELTAVGWSDKTIPVEAIINISGTAVMVSNHVNTPTIDASDVFPHGSSLTINNSGFIYGRGGMGGQGGIFPSTPGSHGQDGGTAISTNLPTKIDNKGRICGGGGGGGGSSGFATIALGQSNSSGDGPGYDAAPITIHGISGGGGAPFGAAGLAQPVRSSQLDVEYGTFLPQPITTIGTAGGIHTGGLRGGNNFVFRTAFVQAGNGGIPGSQGEYATNIERAGPRLTSEGWVDSSGAVNNNSDGYGLAIGLWERVPYGFTEGGHGGQAGFGIIGGANVSWVKIGFLRGRVDNFGMFGTKTLSQYIGPNSKSVSQITGTRPSAPQPYYWGYTGYTEYEYIQTHTQYRQSVNWTTATNNVFYSYSTLTEGVNFNPPYTKIYGSQPKKIGYICFFELPSHGELSLIGYADDALLSRVKLDGREVFISGNGMVQKNQLGTTWNLPCGAGFHALEITIDDTGGTFSGHMFNIRVTKGQFNETVVGADEWFVSHVS